MRAITTLRPLRRSSGWVAAMLVSASLCSTSAAAQGDGAGKILKAMSDYLAGQKSISLTFDSDVEVLTENFQKIQFTSSGQVQLSRPNMVRATRNGGYTDVELTFDGKTVTVLGKHINAYAQADVSGSVDGLIHRLRDEFSIAMPGADLLLGDVLSERDGHKLGDANAGAATERAGFTANEFDRRRLAGEAVAGFQADERPANDVAFSVDRRHACEVTRQVCFAA